MAAPPPEESARAFFAFHLKRLREQRKLSQVSLGKAVHASPSLISSIENCTRTPSLSITKALDRFLGVPQFFEALHPRIIEETGLPVGFAELTDAEGEASTIKLYENFVVTGLFQIEEYARAVLQAAERPDKLEFLVAARMERKELLCREEAPMIIALLDEFAVRRLFGDQEVMAKQYLHLLHLAQEPRIALHIVPADSGLCPEGAFKILHFPESPAIGYAESVGGQGHLIETRRHVAHLDVLFEMIRNKALSGIDSERMVRDLLEAL
ncbi:helix-turn-helix transcriptional regulator [Actinocorallia sp. B10E7]|uniref:helix-turn-helix domain-containing protein n=1 Tax=Actinocorallia sp. B10E7 TaxID=3153558 RepID=UPI00325D8E0D